MTDEEAILDKISATDIIDHGEITSELKEETRLKDVRFSFRKWKKEEQKMPMTHAQRQKC